MRAALLRQITTKPSLWYPIARGSNVGARPSSGLGLAIVHTVVTLHRGTGQLSSTAGQGTAATVQLPLE
ncbi:hypothetical protein C8255_02290 [filamentous cyanobacterium CCP3]|nr:hypothetical protein C8255_02290 [filamentous cyanobacterium CCP3]